MGIAELDPPVAGRVLGLTGMNTRRLFVLLPGWFVPAALFPQWDGSSEWGWALAYGGAAPVMAAAMRRANQKDLARLKQILER